MVRHSIPVTEQTHLSAHLQLLNGLMKLTEKELQILEAFILLGVVNDEARKQVQESLQLKSISNVNNYVKILKDKKVLLGGKGGVYQINPIILPDKEGISFYFSWTPI